MARCTTSATTRTSRTTRRGPLRYTHSPTTQRLRIGLAHSSEEKSGERDDVDFDAYIIRITDADGDVVDEGDDVKTVPNNYGTARTFYSLTRTVPLAPRRTRGFKTADRKLFIYDLAALCLPSTH